MLRPIIPRMDEPLNLAEDRFWHDVAFWLLDGPVSTFGPLTDEQIELFLPEQPPEPPWRG